MKTLTVILLSLARFAYSTSPDTKVAAIKHEDSLALTANVDHEDVERKIREEARPAIRLLRENEIAEIVAIRKDRTKSEAEKKSSIIKRHRLFQQQIIEVLNEDRRKMKAGPPKATSKQSFKGGLK